MLQQMAMWLCYSSDIFDVVICTKNSKIYRFWFEILYLEMAVNPLDHMAFTDWVSKKNGPGQLLLSQ